MRKTLTVLTLTTLFTSVVAEAGGLQRLRKRAEERIKRRVADAVTDAVARKAADAAADAAEKAMGGGDAAGTAPAGTPEGAAESGPSAAETATPLPVTGPPEPEVWDRFDFVPGDRVLFAEDFSSTAVGDFPPRLEFVHGSMDVVRVDGAHRLRLSGRDSRFAVRLPETLPERFTVELEVYDPVGVEGVSVTTTPVRNTSTWPHYYEQSYFNVGHRQGSGVRTKEGHGPTSVTVDPRTGQEFVTVRIQVDGSSAKVYVNENRVANVPGIVLERADRLYFVGEYADPEKPTYLGGIRIAAGGSRLAERLESDGRVAVQGILFDSGSASIRPESTPTLRQLADVLERRIDLRLRIEGHTDSEGDDASNLVLSARRAEAVRSWLAARHGIDPGRLEVAGLGESQAIDTNDTPEGRQNNRRVEIVRI